MKLDSSRLENVRTTPRGITARCPACAEQGRDEKGEHLHVDHEGRFGCVVNPGPDGAEHRKRIFALVGVKEQRDERKPRIVATYDYTDADGRLIFQVVRFEPKDFRQRRPDGAGGWVWNMQGVERVLYRLPAVLKARDASETIYVCEGEKDADTLVGLGLCATCNPGGAGKWQASYNETLTGAHIVILPDRDEPGRKHADLVARALNGKAKSVRVVELPDRDGRLVKDAHDWIGAGGTAAELLELVRTAPIWTPQAETSADPLDPLRALKPGASADEVGRALRETAPLLLSADALTVALARESAVKILTDCGLKTAARIVDAAFGTLGRANAEGDGAGLTLADPEAWPDPVDGGALLDELAQTVRRFVVLDESSAVAFALWTLHAAAHDAAFVSPLLCITSPEKRCGKTTCLQVAGAVVPRPLFASNITPAAIFRTVEKFAPTLLIDEADTFARENEELRGILNCGHTRSAAFVVRTQGDDFEPRLFKTWCPKAIALIGKLPDTLEDRSICIGLERKRAGEGTERLSARILASLEPLRRRCWRWAQDNMAGLEDAEPDTPAGLHDRAADNWHALLAIADACGGEWPDRARSAAVALSGSKGIEPGSIRELLLFDIRDTFTASGSDRLFSSSIVAALSEMEGRPWPELNRGKPITAPRLARMLKPFGIETRTVRIGDERAKGYHLEDFRDAFARYLPPIKRDTVTMPENKGDSDFSKRDTLENVTFQKVEETPVNKGLSRCHVSKPPTKPEQVELTI